MVTVLIGVDDGYLKAAELFLRSSCLPEDQEMQVDAWASSIAHRWYHASTLASIGFAAPYLLSLALFRDRWW